MTVLSIRTFTGEVPRLPADRLPEGGAQFAQNCDFTHGELRPLAGLGPHYQTGPGAQPCRGLFTPDGAKFFAWDKPTRAFLAPTIDDTWQRVYYNTDGLGLRVSQQTYMRDKTDQPRPPATYWKVGVKAPTALSTAVTAGFSVEFFAQTLRYGVLVKEQAVVSSTPAVPGVTYTVVVPADSLIATSGVVGRDPVTGIVDVSATASSGLAGENGAIVTAVAVSEAFAEYFVGDDLMSCSASTGLLSSWSGTVGSKGWLVARMFDGSYGLYLVGPGGVTQLMSPTSITYKGDAIASVAALYDAMRTTTITSDEGVTLRFRAKVYDPATSVVYFDGTCSHVSTGTPLTYTVTVPQFNTLLGNSNNSAVQTVAYVAVAQNIWGEESAPCEAVLVESRQGLTSVTLTVNHTADATQVPLAGMLFYRTYPSLNGDTSYFLINDTPVAGVAGVYTLTDTSVEPPTSTTLAANQAEWDAPNAALTGLSYAGNGVFCGAVGKDLYFSEPYKPHAWPYRMTFPHEVVGVIGIEGGVLVTTTLHPYLVYGAHPEQMSQTRLAAEQSGWSQTSITHVDGAAVYAGNDGLVSVNGGQASIKGSQELFRREDWRKMYGAAKLNLRLAQHDGRLLGIVDPGA